VNVSAGPPAGLAFHMARFPVDALHARLAGKAGFAGRMEALIRILIAWLGASAIATGAETAGRTSVQSLKVTVLSTMLADGGELGEWGFAALVEADGRRILFDTGQRTDVVLKNAATLNVELTNVPDVVLSHWHSDHTGGFLTLRREAMKRSSAALARTHVGEGFFHSRSGVPPGVELNQMVQLKPEYERTGGTFVVHGQPAQLSPGVWLTGPVPRKHPERNWSGQARVRTPAGLVEDTLPDDMALIIDTAAGLVIVTGCGHAGVINIIEHARTVVRPARVHALIGGVHLFNASDSTLRWTAEKLRGFGVDHVLGAHCTGIETMFRLRGDLEMNRATCVIAAVGATFELGRGINPRVIAK
jgi:7,8-dihydropterin-6-yl-methyl-4-(beta-D-ribofuranosyl)aminobenzene 5'-phosphate synthase